MQVESPTGHPYLEIGNGERCTRDESMQTACLLLNFPGRYDTIFLQYNVSVFPEACGFWILFRWNKQPCAAAMEAVRYSVRAMAMCLFML